MAIRRGDGALSRAWSIVPRQSPPVPRALYNVRTIARDVFLVFAAMLLPSIVGVNSRVLTFACPAIMLSFLLSKRAHVPGIVRALQFLMSYCAVWWTFGTWRNLADATAWAESTQLYVWRFERWIFGGELLNARLQRWFYEPGQTQIWDRALIPVYFSFFIASLVVGIVVATRDWDRAWRYFLAKGIVLAVGLAVIFAIPTTPPWMTPDSALTAEAGAAERVYRVTTITVGQGDDFVFKADGNPIAAMPSIHMATTFLVLLLLWSSGRLWRTVGLVYTAAMAFLLVYYGEHYVVDEVVGVLIALGGWRLAASWQRQWSPALSQRLRSGLARIPIPVKPSAASSR